LFPRVKERVEEIPGRHGEVSFGSKLEPRILELHVVVKEEFPFKEREIRKREIAQYLNPTTGHKVLVFADEPDKQYFVKYSGIIDIDRQCTSWFEFTIPFKCNDPYIYSDTSKTKLVSSGSTILTNSGNVSIPFIVKVYGVSNQPSIAIAGKVMQWDSDVEIGKVLIIDTGRLTAVYDGLNALPVHNKVFLKLAPGDNTVSVFGGGTFEFTWIEKWV
jgi:predicted phage tail component-like protein